MSEEKGNVSQLAALFDLTPDGVYDLRRRNIIPRPVVEGQWDIPQCTIKYIRYLRTKHSEAGKEDRGRILRAEANIAEKKDAELDGTLCHRQQCLDDFRDYKARVVSVIQGRKDIADSAKAGTVEEIAAIRLPDLKKEEA